jgi:hypothetical protein
MNLVRTAGMLESRIATVVRPLDLTPASGLRAADAVR